MSTCQQAILALEPVSWTQDDTGRYTSVTTCSPSVFNTFDRILKQQVPGADFKPVFKALQNIYHLPNIKSLDLVSERDPLVWS